MNEKSWIAPEHARMAKAMKWRRDPLTGKRERDIGIPEALRFQRWADNQRRIAEAEKKTLGIS